MLSPLKKNSNTCRNKILYKPTKTKRNKLKRKIKEFYLKKKSVTAHACEYNLGGIKSV